MKSKPKTEDELLIDTYHDLKVLGQTPGGKVLVNAYTSDIVSTLSILASQYKTLTHIEMISMCAGLSEKLSVVQTITRAAEAERELIEQLHT